MNELTEAKLKAKLMEEIETGIPGSVAFRHENKGTIGIPDISVTFDRMTVWMEVKYLAPELYSHGLQSLTMARLAAVGRAWYVYYTNLPGRSPVTAMVLPREHTAIVRKHATPAEVLDRIPVSRKRAGFDHRFVVRFIKTDGQMYEQHQESR